MQKTEWMIIYIFSPRFVVQNFPLYIQKSFERQCYGMAFAGEGELFGVLKFLETLQLDDAAGRLIVRNVQTAWLKLTETSTRDVHEALVEEVASWGVVLRLSRQICSALKLADQGKVLVDLQFQLNRQPLCEWHFAIDRLGATHLNLLFPDQGESEANEVSIRVSFFVTRVSLSLYCVSPVPSLIISVIFLVISHIPILIKLISTSLTNSPCN